MTPAVEIRELSHSFVRRTAARSGTPTTVAALDRVDLDVGPGEFVSLVGSSGCGKSTLLKVVAGVLVPTAGHVHVHGEDVVGRPGVVAYMPQKDLLLPWRRALDNAILGAELNGVPRDQARRAATALLGRFGLEGFERSWPTQLSGGMRQRLALLRTFLLGRDILLLDEPFGALDAITRREMIDWLQGVLPGPTGASGAAGSSVLFVTHDVEEALVLSDRVVVLGARPGRVVAEVGVPFEHPRAPDLVADPQFVALRSEVLAALESGGGRDRTAP